MGQGEVVKPVSPMVIEVSFDANLIDVGHSNLISFMVETGAY